MAIDTAEKRRSVGGVPFLPVGPGVTPDAAKPAAWRQEAGWGYSGIAAGAAAVLVVGVPYFEAALCDVPGAEAGGYDVPGLEAGGGD